LQERSGDISDATPDLLQAQLDNSEGFTDDEALWVRSIDTTQDLDAIISYM
jgi:predicted kinase